MTLKKIGSPEKIKVVNVESALALDLHLAVKHIKDSWTAPTITLDQLHEKLKAIGIIDYQQADMTEVINLLNASGLTVQK